MGLRPSAQKSRQFQALKIARETLKCPHLAELERVFLNRRVRSRRSKQGLPAFSEIQIQNIIRIASKWGIKTTIKTGLVYEEDDANIPETETPGEPVSAPGLQLSDTQG